MMIADEYVTWVLEGEIGSVWYNSNKINNRWKNGNDICTILETVARIKIGATSKPQWYFVFINGKSKAAFATMKEATDFGLSIIPYNPEQTEIKPVEKQIVKRSKILQAFADRSPITITDHNGMAYTGRIASLEHEDDSGYCFNITLECGYTGFIRTIK